MKYTDEEKTKLLKLDLGEVMDKLCLENDEEKKGFLFYVCAEKGKEKRIENQIKSIILKHKHQDGKVILE